jgi:hypothetical protein
LNYQGNKKIYYSSARISGINNQEDGRVEILIRKVTSLDGYSQMAKDGWDEGVFAGATSTVFAALGAIITAPFVPLQIIDGECILVLKNKNHLEKFRTAWSAISGRH